LEEATVKQNCWQVKKCGREPGGANVSHLGVCPAAIETALNGINGGKNAGRACWAIAGTLCDGKVQGTFAQKMINCLECEFYQQVVAEEGPDYQSFKDILAKIS
jgi:hypothetical protein